MESFLQDSILAADRIRDHQGAVDWLSRWLQPQIPFEALIIASGNFLTEEIRADVIGDLTGAARPLDPVSYLRIAIPGVHRRWLNYRRTSTIVPSPMPARLRPFGSPLSLQAHEALVHGVAAPQQKIETCFMFFNRRFVEPAECKRSLTVLTPVLYALHTRISDWPMRALNPPPTAEIKRRCHLSGSTPIADYPELIVEHFGLTERELEIMHWVCLGKTNAEIGDILILSPHTVKNHLQRVFGRLTVRSRAQALARLESLRQLSNENGEGR